MDERKVIALENPGVGEKDALTEVLRNGARKMLAEAIEAQVEEFLCAHCPVQDGLGPPSGGS